MISRAGPIFWTLFLLFGTGVTELSSISKTKRTDEIKIEQKLHKNSSDLSDELEDSWVHIPHESHLEISPVVEKSVEEGDEDEYLEPQSAELGYGRSKGLNEPFFDHAMMTNISEQIESHVFLRCRVKNLGDRTVSWIRRRDWHILTSGRTVYTNDDRFKIKHNEGSEEWILVIEYVQTRDNGTYECQVSTSSGTIAHFFNLNVLVPQAYILGAKEYHVQQGTVISLVCIVENSPRQSPQYLYWYHNNQMVNYGTGVSVHTEPGIHTHSRLTVPSAGPQHSGNYTCKASNTLPASVQVFVSEGDSPAAIQRQGGSKIKLDSIFTPYIITHLILNLFST